MPQPPKPGEWSWKLLRTGTRGRYRMVERRMVMEYLATRCAKALWRAAHKRLGALPKQLRRVSPGLPESAKRVYLPYVDAVCVWEDRIELIEFKVHDPLKAIAQLKMYRALALRDPELQRFMPRPIVAKLVYWRDDPNIRAMCDAEGIALEIYYPKWLKPILREYGYEV